MPGALVWECNGMRCRRSGGDTRGIARVAASAQGQRDGYQYRERDNPFHRNLRLLAFATFFSFPFLQLLGGQDARRTAGGTPVLLTIRTSTIRTRTTTSTRSISR